MAGGWEWAGWVLGELSGAPRSAAGEHRACLQFHGLPCDGALLQALCAGGGPAGGEHWHGAAQAGARQGEQMLSFVMFRTMFAPMGR